MCHLVRYPAAEPERGASSPASEPGLVRSRWAGVAAAAAIGGLAFAALLAPSPTAPLVPPQPAAALAPTTTEVQAGPTVERVVERFVLSGDDGLPTGATETVKSGGGGCHESL